MIRRLTDWESGEPVYVAFAAIRSCRRLPASVYEIGGAPHERGERTRIDTATDQFLVRETPDEVFCVTPAANGGGS